MKNFLTRLSRALGVVQGWIGALPARRVTWSLVALFSAWVLLDVLALRLTTGLANSTYDAMVRWRFHAAAPDPRIVIVDIDEASLAAMSKEFGRWPWPRDTLATVLGHIESQQPAAVVWDIVFSDADRLSPGGDAAMDAAVKRSPHSHFSVVRLPQANDGASQITRAHLPGLWAPGPAAQAAAARPATIALIPPVLPAIEKASLGYNNGYVDRDGVLRRYRYFEALTDGSRVQSVAMAVARAVNPAGYQARLEGGQPQGELMAWRKRDDAYPRVPFAQVFAQAEGQGGNRPMYNFADKVVVVGSTAPSLHDIHPTPLSNMGAGVSSLATAIDNALNDHQLRELPRWLQAALAIGLCAGLAAWVQFKSAASLAPALLALPAALLALSYLSLNGLPVFIDLHLAAGLALVFLALLRTWADLRRNHWCAPPRAGEPLALWGLQRAKPWLDAPLDRLIDALEQHAPTCRVVVCDTNISWPSTLRWPELARFAAIVGPADALARARPLLEPMVGRLAPSHSAILNLPPGTNREQLAREVLTLWSHLGQEGHNPN